MGTENLNEGRLMPLLGTVLGEVRAERVRQHMRRGEQNWPDGTNESGLGERIAADTGFDLETDARLQLSMAPTYAAILAEEVGEALCEEDPDKLEAELIQVAAVAVAWVERIRRDRAAKGAR